MVETKALIAEIQGALDALPTRKFQKQNGSRRGAQLLAFACIYEVAKANSLFADPEFETRYVGLDGQQKRGFIDVVIQEPNHFRGLLLACEIVTDKVKYKDLLKLRDAAVSGRGIKLVIQLNPYESYPVTAMKALTDHVTDDEAAGILLMRYRRKCRTLLERRQAALWAIGQREVDAERARCAF